jgi:phosphoglucosamine mutase
MGLVAADMLKKETLARRAVVATVMSNIGLEMALKAMGADLIRTPVGDRYVVERMRGGGFNFGGEQSGHLIFLDHNTSGDGVLSALQVMRIMKETGKPLSELAAFVTKYPQVQKSVEVRHRRDLNEVAEIKKALADGEHRLQGRGRLLVRYSGTQPLCRVMAEGEDEEVVRVVCNMVADAISRNLS